MLDHVRKLRKMNQFLVDALSTDELSTINIWISKLPVPGSEADTALTPRSEADTALTPRSEADTALTPRSETDAALTPRLVRSRSQQVLVASELANQLVDSHVDASAVQLVSLPPGKRQLARSQDPGLLDRKKKTSGD